MNFVVFVEGDTERKALGQFLKRWLDPRLNQPVGVKVISSRGWASYRKEVKAKVHLHLSGRGSTDTIAAIGLLDLYGPDFYPPHVQSAEDRRAWAKQDIERHVAHPRFRQHFAVHEVEAWLLAEPDVLPPRVRDALPGKCAQPETINFDEPPARLLDQLYRQRLGRRYAKVIDGSDLFRKLAPDKAYAACPSLKAMLDDMHQLAASAEVG